MPVVSRLRRSLLILSLALAAPGPVPARASDPPPAEAGSFSAASPAAGASLVVRGAGWGHSVGMMQYGAYAQAQEGRSAGDIIGHYYQGAGIRTLSGLLGRGAAHLGYLALVLGAYVTLSLGVMLGALPVTSLLAMLSLPLVVQVLRSSELGASGQARAISMIDLETARLHLTFGALLVAGVALAAFIR